MKDYLKTILSFWLEILFGLIILFNTDDIRYFLFYFFIVFLVLSSKYADFLRKLIRVFQVFNEIKILTIIRKLKISEEEISIVTEDEKNKIGKDDWEIIEKEFSELSLKN